MAFFDKTKQALDSTFTLLILQVYPQNANQALHAYGAISTPPPPISNAYGAITNLQRLWRNHQSPTPMAQSQISALLAVGAI